jgi:hypothetical protein
MNETPKSCDLCGDADSSLFLLSRCHPTAPLRAIKEGNTLILKCYIPDCDREVARLKLAPPTYGEVYDMGKL